MFARQKTRVYVINSLISKNTIESPKRKTMVSFKSASFALIAFGIIGLFCYLYKKDSSK